MDIRDSRRVPGPNLHWEHSSAVLDVSLAPNEVERFHELYPRQLERLCAAIGLRESKLKVRRFAGGASLATSSELDTLYTATEVNEWAFAATRAIVAGESEPPLEPAVAELGAALARERAQRPRLLELGRKAARRGVAFISEDRVTSIGMGGGSMSFPTNAIPSLASIDWSRVHDVPCVMVTGTNGKSTTVRLLGAIASAAGKMPGLSSTDWVRVGDVELDRGDYSGPAGARLVLRDARVEAAILETARGGMLRRGLVLRRVDAAALLNVAEDHLGEWGVDDVATLVEAKWVISRAVEKSGRLVLNADDPLVVKRATDYRGAITWFTLDPKNELVRRHVASGGDAAIFDDPQLTLVKSGKRELITSVDAVRIAFGGAARHNVANALAAIALADRMGFDAAAMARGLAAFRGDADENPGRLNVFDLGGVRALLDFAHNPHGYVAFFDMVERLPAKRRAVLLGQAGDRDEASIRELVRIACRCRPDLVVVKEMPAYLRGRQLGEVPAMINDELAKLGIQSERIVQAPSELEAMKRALEWSQPGDLLLLLSHSEREAALELLGSLRTRGWKPGDALEA
ncbi:MAG: Mur ligase [Planctomycetes bacterium]|nr:Mur ligase [Planctomycetota bacterium]